MAKFSAQHYEAIADVLRHIDRDTSTCTPRDAVDYVRTALATMLEDDNPRFNRQFFMAAARPDVPIQH